MARLDADRYILDGYNIFKPLKKRGVIVENKADTTYLSVMAASILAKNARDHSMDSYFQQFETEFGLVKGGGYANQATIEFIRWYKNRFSSLPQVLRRSYQYKKLYDIFAKKG